MERIKENKILKVLGVLIISIVILLVTRITYAYLAPLISEGKNVDISGNADLVDDFKLEVGDALVLNATPTTLPENGSNYVSSTKVTAKLRANSTNNSASKNYYIYFKIDNNTFKHINAGSPEILLSIKSPNGDAITSLGDLTYGTFNGVSGFDVTEVNGVFTIADNYLIESTSSNEYTTQEWTITLTYLNQSYDQSGNFGNSFETSVYFKKEEMQTLADYVKSQYTGTQGTNHLYYHDSSLENGASDNSYRYAGAYETVNNYACYSTNNKTCDSTSLGMFRIIGVFNENNHGVGGASLVKVIQADYNTTFNDSVGTFTASYYDLSNVSTYKGSNTEIPTFYWRLGTTESWANAGLNINTINESIFNRLHDTTYMENVSWKISPSFYGFSFGSTIKDTYDTEVLNNSNTTSGYAGLMYLSDYGFAAENAWASGISVISDFKYNNWMYLGLKEWTISTMADTTLDQYIDYITENGDVSTTESSSMAIRVTAYLKENTYYVSGSGTKDDPMLFTII